MEIQFIEPLSRAITRTIRDLFRPFDLRKWFVVGFTAFLAGLTDAQFSGGSSSGWRRGSKANIEDVFSFPQRAWEWLGSNPGWMLLLILMVLFGFKHPAPMDDSTPLDGKRKLLGGIAFLAFFLSFTPAPFPQFVDEFKQIFRWL